MKYGFFMMVLLCISRGESSKGLDLRWNYLMNPYCLPKAWLILGLDEKIDSVALHTYFEATGRERWQVCKASLEFKKVPIFGRSLDLGIGDGECRMSNSTINLRGIRLKLGDSWFAAGKVRSGAWEHPSFMENKYFFSVKRYFSILDNRDFQVSIVSRRDRTEGDGSFDNRNIIVGWNCTPKEIFAFPLELSLSMNNLGGKETIDFSYGIGGRIKERNYLLSISYKQAGQKYIPTANLRRGSRSNLRLTTEYKLVKFLRVNGQFNLDQSATPGYFSRLARYRVGANLRIPQFPSLTIEYESNRQKSIREDVRTRAKSGMFYFQLLKEISGLQFRLDGRSKRWEGSYYDAYTLYSLSMSKRWRIMELGLKEAVERGHTKSSISLRITPDTSISLSHELTLSNQGSTFSIGGHLLLPHRVTLWFAHRNEIGLQKGASFWISLGKKFSLEHLGEVGGVVFTDLNRNGEIDPGEEGVENIVIMLDGVFKCYTDLKGEFKFKNVKSGIHTVSMDISSLPAHYNPFLPIDQEIWTRWIGSSRVEFPVYPIAGVGGKVFVDINHNNHLDEYEKGLSGVVVVNLTSGAKRITDENGEYYFEDVSLGVNRIAIDTAGLERRYRATGMVIREVELSSYRQINDINFQVIKTGDQSSSTLFKVGGIYFKRNSSQLIPSSYSLLELALRLLKTHSVGDVIIEIFCDSANLAEKRYRVLVDYFISKGIPGERLKLKLRSSEVDSRRDTAEISIRVDSGL